MLIKEELKKVPPCECPKISKKELSKKPKYLVAAEICEVSRCGKILVADYYSTETKTLQVRFFSDGKNYTSYITENNSFSNKSLKSLLEGHQYIPYKKEQFLPVCEFLNINEPYKDTAFYIGWERYEGIFGACSFFIANKQSDKNEKARNRKWNKICFHLSMFPNKYPSEVDEWANEIAFNTGYIFFSNLDKGKKRRGLCSSCGKSFSLPKEIKHNQIGQCPKCHREATYCADRYKTSKSDEITICYPFKKDNQLLLEWSTCERTFYMNGKPRFYYEPFARTLYLNEKDSQKIYSYGTTKSWYNNTGGWSSWGKTPVYRKAFVYTNSLNDIFGEKYYNVDLKEIILKEQRPIDFVKLLDNLKNIPQSEYLCKLGLTMLASELKEADYFDGKSFSECLGINQQYLSMYRECSVTSSEHYSIRNVKEYVTPKWLVQYRETVAEIKSVTILDELLNYMTLNKFCRYSAKQLEIHTDETLYHISIWMRDYINMCESLDIRMRKNNLFPRDIKKAHDDIDTRYKEVMAERKERSKSEALELVNNLFTSYEKDQFTVLIPKDRQDFIREGQELSHCVGGPSYYERHINGEKMIFFIRLISNPQKAYYTAEIDMNTFIVTQLYGYGDKSAPPDVRKFTKEFANWLKRQKIYLRKAG